MSILKRWENQAMSGMAKMAHTCRNAPPTEFKSCCKAHLPATSKISIYLKIDRSSLHSPPILMIQLLTQMHSSMLHFPMSYTPNPSNHPLSDAPWHVPTSSSRGPQRPGQLRATCQAQNAADEMPRLPRNISARSEALLNECIHL